MSKDSPLPFSLVHSVFFACVALACLFVCFGVNEQEIVLCARECVFLQFIVQFISLVSHRNVFDHQSNFSTDQTSHIPNPTPF